MKHTIVTLGISALLPFLSTGCGRSAGGVPGAGPRTDTLAAFTLRAASVGKDLSFPGELIPRDRAMILAKVSGYVKEMKVDIGDQVRKGDVLAVLDAPELIANLAQVNADVQTARSKYLGSFDRYNRFVRAAKVPGTIAEGEIETVKSQMLADSAALDAARSKRDAFSQLKEYLVIRAPFAGVVTQRTVDPGTLVGTGDRTPMLVLEDNSTLRLRIPVPESYTSLAMDTMRGSFTVAAQPGVVFGATLSRRGNALNLVNRTETWEFLFDNAKRRLKSGMFATATLAMRRPDSSFVVPPRAEMTNQERQIVVRLRNGVAEWVDVRNGLDLGDRVEVFGDLHPGDTILSNGAEEIKPGKRVVASIKGR